MVRVSIKLMEKLFPRNSNNNYLGSVITKYVFILVSVVTVVRSLIHFVYKDGGA